MRLDFNVLWVEDQSVAVQSQKDRLEHLIRREGFRLRVQFAPTVAAATGFLSENVYADHVDLILMDYDLGSEPYGDTGLIEIRMLMPYKDVIFYSAQVNNLREILRDANVDGIYLSNREELPERANGVFQSLVQKILDIDHSRGLVMGATSDIDHYVNDCLIWVFNNCDPDSQTKILDAMLKRVKEIKKRFNEIIGEIEAVKHVSELVDKYAVYTSVDRLNLLRKALQINNLHRDKDELMKRYVSEIMPKRNDLAHLRVESNGFVRKLKDRKGTEFTGAEMLALRLALLESQEMFEELARALSPPM